MELHAAKIRLKINKGIIVRNIFFINLQSLYLVLKLPVFWTGS
jgi:hypothetical protein